MGAKRCVSTLSVLVVRNGPNEVVIRFDSLTGPNNMQAIWLRFRDSFVGVSHWGECV